MEKCSTNRRFLTVFLSELWNDELQSRKKRKDPFSPDKKKPVVVSDILPLSLLFGNTVFFKADLAKHHSLLLYDLLRQ